MKKALIEFRDFSFRYKTQNEYTLKDINLTIYEGEKVLLLGPSGCGKSTLSNCINGLVPFSFPGEIKGLEIGPGQEMIVQKSAFLAAEAGVNLSIHFQKRLGAGFFGGEGFIMQRLSGRGAAFVEIDGDLMEYNLKPGQSIIVDTGNVAGFEPSVQMDIQQVQGAKNIFFGGEGLFNTVLTGPGRVWLQTMPIYNVANAIRPYIPTGGNN